MITDEKLEALQDLGDYLAEKFPTDIVSQAVTNGELSIVVLAAGLLKISKFARDDANCQFKTCVDVCGVDFPDRDPRFEVVYNLLSLKHNLRLRLKVLTDDEKAVPSVTSIWPSANWFEREVWDMYGLFFSDHPDLRRILTDYGFEGHPQRKDFPLTGYVEVRYDDEQRRVIYEPVTLRQDFRSFDFLSPWEGMTPHLPGDEKADVPAEDAKEGGA